MLKLLLRKFPLHQLQFTRLYEQNSDFREICEDYIEASQALATWVEMSVNSQKYADEYLYVLRNLEMEILEYVETDAVDQTDSMNQGNNDHPKEAEHD